MSVRLIVMVVGLLVEFCRGDAVVTSAVGRLSQAKSEVALGTCDDIILIAGGTLNNTLPTSRIETWSRRNLVGGTTSILKDILSHAREPIVGSNGNYLYFAGGNVNATPTDAGDLYDCRSKKWSYIPLPKARQNHAVASVKNLALFAGGDNGTDVFDSVDVFDFNTKKFRTSMKLSVGRNILAGVAVLDRWALFAGGNFANGSVSAVVDIYDSSTNQWTTGQLSIARRLLGATSVGSKAFFAGGRAATTRVSRVDIYDVKDKTWTTSELSAARSYLVATSVGTFAVFAGGLLTSLETSNVVDIYDTLLQSWSTKSLSVGRAILSAISLDNIAFFAGGVTNVLTDPFLATAVTDILTIDRSGGFFWNKGTNSIAGGRASPAVVSAWGLLFVAGGKNASSYSNSVQIFDPELRVTYSGTLSVARGEIQGTTASTQSATWVILGGGRNEQGPSNQVDIFVLSNKRALTPIRKTATLSHARVAHAAASSGSQALFAGGNGTTGQVLKSVDIYDAAQASWTTSSLSEARAYLTGIGINDKAFFAGGINSLKAPSSTVDIHDCSQGRWKKALLSVARSHLTSTAVGNLVLFAGGLGTGQVPSAVVDIYNLRSGRWTASALSSARYSLTSTFISITSPNKQFALFAGGSTASNTSSTVDIYNLNTNTWESPVLLPQPTTQLGSASIANVAYFVGGIGPSGVQLSAIQSLYYFPRPNIADGDDDDDDDGHY